MALKKAKLYVYGENKTDEIEVMFNPTEYNLSESFLLRFSARNCRLIFCGICMRLYCKICKCAPIFMRASLRFSI